ncbi:glyoxylate reductase/hydroxypyruvate reductase-like [Platysternon megacephalum]|uniref:Glyoxylate reductase/hydroxypyruvate reductase-like n=1 Tax=Platysternon megacephalum TaxID=55544 RepID=A0A4D9DJH8_9SAUR|nr:glyoxylate reductase/hydroxypyruvate reductase-like [Platysternon megacephalum]
MCRDPHPPFQTERGNAFNLPPSPLCRNSPRSSLPLSAIACSVSQGSLRIEAKGNLNADPLGAVLGQCGRACVSGQFSVQPSALSHRIIESQGWKGPQESSLLCRPPLPLGYGTACKAAPWGNDTHLGPPAGCLWPACRSSEPVWGPASGNPPSPRGPSHAPRSESVTGVEME